MFNADFREGLKSGFPIALSAAPFGALFGAVAVDNGLSVTEATIMSGTVYAGASQLVGIELFGQKVAPWLIVLSVFAVNFRHILYSAAIARMISNWSFLQKAAGFFVLVDPQFAESVRKYENTGTVGFSWYMGFAAPVYVLWLAMDHSRRIARQYGRRSESNWPRCAAADLFHGHGAELPPAGEFLPCHAGKRGWRNGCLSHRRLPVACEPRRGRRNSRCGPLSAETERRIEF
ncbi:putative branched-chain amino acid permease (Azaleucine resistance) [Agrobacterium tumefaciens]|nr:putative branched-chain amino acid permease (Azaleucine resistance) [Agrobacterium tumefaciens]